MQYAEAGFGIPILCGGAPSPEGDTAALPEQAGNSKHNVPRTAGFLIIAFSSSPFVDDVGNTINRIGPPASK